ncbi:MAG: glycoside hydrolase family protein [Alphaproteobacteria bacterium]|nr:glycoside hydrolase family protein [Alphaproteobacteria bacterium]
MSGRLRTSRAGLELIKSFEGFREAAARLPDGRWTIGYGHVRSAREGVTISEQDAEDLLRYDLQGVEEAIESLVYAPLNANQFDALASLVFNISPGQFKDSELLRRLNAGEYISAASAFDSWRKARVNGSVIVVDALVRRRTMEKAMFLEPPDGRPAAPTPLVTPEVDIVALAQAPREAPVEVSAPLARGPATAAARPAARPSSAANDDSSVSEIRKAIGNLISKPAPATEPASVPPATPEDASKVVAARIARILERAEKSVETFVQGSAPPAAAAATVREIPEDLPDFDVPVAAGPRPRIFIDDTEVFDPGRDPAELFAEGEALERAVNGGRKPLGAVSAAKSGAGAAAWFPRMAPWIAILVLSVLGVAIGLVDSFRDVGADVAHRVNASTTVLAVSGLMLIMSIYFLTTRSMDHER